ncbi:SET domain-containing protein-lysine N-methyltransferase [Thiovibrio sp. JS02]
MLVVKTYLAPSKVHGIGLYAAEDIPAQTPVWKFNRFIDKIISEKTFLRMCRQVDRCSLQHLLNSTYRRNDKYFYLTDNARFINHSEARYNIAFVDDFTEVATQPIYAHEELLENYLLSYDSSDFFFQEMRNPDPHTYLLSIATGGRSHVHN